MDDHRSPTFLALAAALLAAAILLAIAGAALWAGAQPVPAGSAPAAPALSQAKSG